jgi:hypothetical protein
LAGRSPLSRGWWVLDPLERNKSMLAKGVRQMA